jgi:hypothetical protein
MKNAGGPPRRKVLRVKALRSTPPTEGGNFLARGQNRGVLFGQCCLTLSRTGLANRYDHGILAPYHAGVSLFLFALAHVSQSGTVELVNLFTVDRAVFTIRKGRLVASGHTNKAQPNLTLGIFDDFELSSHFLFPLGDECILPDFFAPVNP